MNQGILSSIFSLGSIIVMAGSVIYIKEKVRFCEYMGTVFIIVGTIVISMSKKGGSEDGSEVAIEGPLLSIMFGKLHLTNSHSFMHLFRNKVFNFEVHRNFLFD